MALVTRVADHKCGDTALNSCFRGLPWSTEGFVMALCAFPMGYGAPYVHHIVLMGFKAAA
jgi:hypothetical protein